ncbi:MAG: Smr/MutS family protein [Janthinobacterium lividum]
MTSSDDDDWRKFSQTVKPLIAKDRNLISWSHKKVHIAQRFELKSHPFLPLEFASTALSVTASVDKYQKNLNKSSIDATLDLHGEIIKDAYPILIRFIEKAVQFDHRIILIITGKSLGKAFSDAPRLVKMVPFWLKSPPLNQYIKKITYAKQAHGGDGAFYVFLKSLNRLY